MRVIITGATGFIGRALCSELAGDYEVIGLTRDAERAKDVLPDGVGAVEWDGVSAEGWAQHADGAHAIINLAGENVASGLWTKGKRQAILDSRINAGHAVADAIEKAETKPKVLIQGSAVGFYGSRGDETLDESSPPGEGFLAEVTRQWEPSTEPVEGMGVRRVVIRTGVVLGATGGALPRMALPFRFFFGGHPGSGEQWLPWIHIADEVGAIRFLMQHDDLSGVLNLASPEPATMREFCRALGKVLGRWSWFHPPGFLLRLAMGAMAREMLLASQRAMPRRLLDAGYEFAHPSVDSALQDILGEG